MNERQKQVHKRMMERLPVRTHCLSMEPEIVRSFPHKKVTSELEKEILLLTEEGWTREMIAEKVGVSLSTIWRVRVKNEKKAQPERATQQSVETVQRVREAVSL